MEIQSEKGCYEVVQKLSEGETAAHFKCRLKKESGSPYFHMIQLKRKAVKTEHILYIQEIVENSAFLDFQEYFMDESFMYLVFIFPTGKPLTACLEAAALSLEQRFLLGRQVMERVLLLMLPVYLQWEVLRPETIWVVGVGVSGVGVSGVGAENIGVESGGTGAGREEMGGADGDLEVGFYYEMNEMDRYGEILPSYVSKEMGALFALLFAGEKKSGLYPEFQKFEQFLEHNDGGEFLDLYKQYLLLTPVFGEERKPEEKKKEPVLPKIKARMGTIFKILKIAAGITVIAASLAALVPVWKEKIYPVIESGYLIKSMEAGAPEAAGYSGKVEISSPGTGQIIWKGRLEEGRRSGYGFQYDPFGRLEYEGEYLSDLYSGQGILYDQNGTIRYRGSFLEGDFDGSGIQYDRSGELLYKGQFALGERSGEGTLYEEKGQILYEGGFSKGKPDGEGIFYKDGHVKEKGVFEKGKLVDGQAALYGDAGELLYRGEIKDGKREGEGTAFMGEILIYEGAFKKDRYEGMGKYYSPENGKLLYQGEFLDGMYSGTGVLYNPETEFPVYDGSFRLGFYDGEGMEYDSRGYLRYQGNFLLGAYNGNGVLYVPETGMVLQEGEFRNGMLVTSKAELAAMEAMEAEKMAEAGGAAETGGAMEADGTAEAGGVAEADGAAEAGGVVEADGKEAGGAAETGGAEAGGEAEAGETAKAGEAAKAGGAAEAGVPSGPGVPTDTPKGAGLTEAGPGKNERGPAYEGD